MSLKNIQTKVKNRMEAHARTFGYHDIPNREIFIDEEKSLEYIELVDKSIHDGIDYLPERYGIDVDQHKKPIPDIIYD